MRIRFPRAAALIAVVALLPWVSMGQRSTRKTTSKKPAKKTTRKTAPKKAAAPVVRFDAGAWLDRMREVPVENVAALVPFFEQLYRHEKGQGEGGLHILHYGDSHTAADDWTGFLRALFQNRFGDGGSGFTYAGRPWNSFRRLDLRAAGSKGWYSDGLAGRVGDGLYGLGGVSITTSRPRETVALEVACESLELFYLKQPGGGAVEFRDNGELVERIETNGELGPGFYRYTPGAGVHRFTLETMERAPVRLFGWVAEHARGVTYETLGINGAQASIVFNWEEKLLASHLRRRDPALIVLAYGTNEAGNKDWTLEKYREMYASLIHRFRQMTPTASILVIGPPDRYYRVRNRGWVVYDNVDRIVEAQRQAALGTGCAFWDMRGKMGGKGSMRQWVDAGLAQRDYVHFTSPGYRLMGGAVFQDIMDHYATFAKVREQLIGTQLHGQTRDTH